MSIPSGKCLYRKAFVHQGGSITVHDMKIFFVEFT